MRRRPSWRSSTSSTCRSRGGEVPFDVDVPSGLIEERAHYTVRVHVDVTGTGVVERGDLVSTQSHPVLTGGRPDEASVPVKVV